MNLIFNAREIIHRQKGLTFNDVLLVPKYSEISSRKFPNLKTRITRNYTMEIPIVSANMDTITETKMMIAMAKLGGVGILHRFMSPEEQLEAIQVVKQTMQEKNITSPISASIGVKEEERKRADLLVEAGVQILTIDIAHGDSIMLMDMLDYVKKNYPKIDVITGNVATGDGVKRMVDHGSDAVKVGIGPGSMCTTRVVTGHGVPQLTAISLCVEEAKKHQIPVIADGGVTHSGDIIKALASGADAVMLGSLLAGTMETPGEIKKGMKLYRGMASKSAQVSWRGELPKGMAAEGESTMVPCKGSAQDVVLELIGGIRSGMSYMGSENISDMYENALFMEMTVAGAHESRPHGLKL